MKLIGRLSIERARGKWRLCWFIPDKKIGHGWGNYMIIFPRW